MTPLEAWHGSKPKVYHLRVIGSDAYAHIPKDEWSKFNSKTRKCIMLGYGTVTKGYRLYDVEHKKILHSQDYSSTRTPNKLSKAPKMSTID